MRDRQPIGYLLRLIALSVGVLLLAAPTAFACRQFGARACESPMAGLIPATDMAGCCDCGDLSAVCADLESVRDSKQAAALETVEPLAAVDTPALPVFTSIAPPGLAPHSTPVDAFSRHDVGRYTLFSSFLL